MAATKQSTHKAPTALESASTVMQSSDFDIVECNVRFIKHFVHDDQRRTMLLITVNNETRKVYCFPEVVDGLRAPFKAELLLEKRGDYWNVNAVAEL